MKVNNFYPKIRFKGFTNAWEQVKLGDIGTHYTTGNLGYADIEKNGLYKCVLYGELYTKYNEVITEVFSRTNKAGTIAQPNDILFPTSTTVDAQSLISPSCINVEDTVVGGDLFGFRPFKNFNGNFLSFYLNGHSKIKFKLAQRAQGLTIIHIQFSSINEVLLNIPQLSEQQKIASFFKNFDSLTTLHQHKLLLLKNLKKALLKKMFADEKYPFPQIRFKGFTHAWVQERLGDLCEFKNGKAHENFVVANGKYTLINSKFISTDGAISKTTNIQLSPLQKDEITIVLSDVPKGKALAKTFVIDKNNKYTLNQRIGSLKVFSSNDVYFINLIINRNKYFLSFDDKVNQTNLTNLVILECKINLTNICEQLKISSIFQSLNSIITLHEKKLLLLKNLKKALLEKMFV